MPGMPVALELAAERARLPVRRVRRYVRIGLVTPTESGGRRALFDEVGLATLRRIRRLSDDLGLDSEAIRIVLRLIDRIDALQHELDRRPARTMEARTWQRRPD
jgi:MerR family transcriptional regulator/heat shock protein HspR